MHKGRLLQRVSKVPDTASARTLHITEGEAAARYAFVFVCQAGEWETKALLLAGSLRRQLGACVDLIAAVPEPEGFWGRLSAATPLPRGPVYSARPRRSRLLPRSSDAPTSRR